MANEQLQQYVAAEKARGVTDVALREELSRTGWAVKDIEEVMAPIGEQLSLHMVVPSNLGFFRRLAFGRIGRLRYFLGTLFGLVISIIPVAILVALWGVLGYLESSTVGLSDNPFVGMVNMFIPILLALALILPLVFLNIMLSIRRLHDLNMSGWFMLICYIPYVGGLFSLYMIFAPGTGSANNFGAPSDSKKEFIADIFNKSRN